MMANSIVALLALSFPLGMLHALDPDHVLAVATLTGREKTSSRAFAYAVQWAVGHGGLLLLVTAGALIFHWMLPKDVPYWAERSVGLILILTGASVLLNIRNEHFHQDGHIGDRSGKHSPFRAPFLVGIVHGTAGSAPFLALIPAAFLSPMMGIVYVGIFSIGVLGGMLCFAMLLRYGHEWLDQRAQSLGYASRGAFALVAMGAGVFWIMG